MTFIAFTEAMSTMDVTQLWSVMFFMMVLTLGIGTMLGTYEAVRTTVIDLKIIPLRKELVSRKENFLFSSRMQVDLTLS